jgi:hypothetical protein
VRVLAEMLDLQATVRLAHGLAEPDVAATDGRWRAPLLLGDYVRKRLAAVDEAASRRFARPFDGPRVRVSDAAQLADRIMASGATKSPEAARAFAVETWDEYRYHFVVSVARVRAEVGALRDEIGVDLRDAGPRGAKLEALDTILRAAIDDHVPVLCERLAIAMEEPFVAALAAATLAVAREDGVVDAAAITPWFKARGVLGAQLARSAEVTRALFAREARVIETLVDAACAEGDVGEDGPAAGGAQ